MSKRRRLALLLVVSCCFLGEAKGQVTFDFDSGPLDAATPLDQAAGGITAHFSSPGDSIHQGYALWAVGTYGISPSGFSGNCLYPASVFQSDLQISFSASLQSISLLYAPDELATDSSCTMRITAYSGLTQVDTTTTTAPVPGTYPTGTLQLSPAQSFDKVLIHYEAPPITGGDYGQIFLVDNVIVTPVPEPLSSATVSLLLAFLVGLAFRRKGC